MYTFQYFDFESIPLDQGIIETIASEIEKSNGIKQSGIITLSLLPDERMRELNREYRTIDSTTDILSFGYFGPDEPVSKNDVFGELLFSESKLHSQAVEHGHTITEEAYRLIVHGILHLQGYDHEEDEDYESMWKHEKHVIGTLQKKFGILKSEL